MFLSKLHWFSLGLIAAPSPSSQLLRLRLEVDKDARTSDGPGRRLIILFGRGRHRHEAAVVLYVSEYSSSRVSSRQCYTIEKMDIYNARAAPATPAQYLRKIAVSCRQYCANPAYSADYPRY
eukprot:COSAG03_NODE_10799_length_627_cov_172.543561_1_plen_121_part_01